MTQQKVIDRVRKLLELTKSSNEHEAANAAARAAELMIEHEISEAQISAANESEAPALKPVKDECVASDGKIVEWKRRLVGGLCAAFGCNHYFYHGSRWGSRARYHAVGTEDAINAVRTMHAILVAEVNRLASDAYAEEVEECRDSGVQPPGARAWKSAFRVGCANMVARRLAEQRATSIKAARNDASKSQAIMVVDRQKEALAVKWQELSRGFSGGYQTSAGGSSRSGYSAGSAAGRNVNLGGNAALGSGKKQLS
jgi:hypothetical protein